MRMKYLNRLLFFVAVIGIYSCTKNDYYKDSSTHDPNFNGNIMQYLESRSKDSTSLFDSLVYIIKLSGLEPTLSNDKITFFAPTDRSIGKAILALNRNLFAEGQDTILKMDQIKPEVWSKLLKGYMIEGDFGLVDFPQMDTINLVSYGGRLHQTYDSDLVMNVGVVYHDFINGSTRINYGGHRQLLYSFIPDISRPKSNLINGYISTSNIKPTNGRIHVIDYIRHGFGFMDIRFIQLVKEYGINY